MLTVDDLTDRIHPLDGARLSTCPVEMAAEVAIYLLRATNGQPEDARHFAGGTRNVVR